MDAGRHARSLIAYTRWADDRVLDAAAALDEATLDRKLDDTLASMRSVLIHMLGTHGFWLARWTGAPQPQDLVSPALDELRAAYTASHDALAAFASGLGDADWERSEQWWREWGYEDRAPLGQMLVQVVNHGTQHRSEIAVMLTAFGSSPGDLDYLRYLSEAAASGTVG